MPVLYYSEVDKECSNCHLIKELSNFGKNKNSPSGYGYTCKECQKTKSAIRYIQTKDKHNKRQREYYSRNSEKIKESHRQYYLENKDKKIKRQRVYQTERYNNDNVFKLSRLVRSRIHRTLKKHSTFKSVYFKEYIGCTPEELFIHIEKQFKPGMNWDNYSMHGWHVDHIIPLASAKNEQELYKLCHYTNLQPLWAEENLSKGAK